MGYYKATTGNPQGQPTARGPLALDYGVQNYTIPAQWRPRSWWAAKRRQGRSFHRAMSGLRVPGRYVLVTLTSGPDSPSTIQPSWKALLQQLRRWGHFRGCMRVTELTKAGRPHIHAIVRVDRYLPPSLLRMWWIRIHRAPIVHLAAVRGHRGMAGYLAKYLGKDPLSRYGWTQDWVYAGFVADWRRMCRLGFRRNLAFGSVLQAWHNHLDVWRDRALALGRWGNYFPWLSLPCATGSGVVALGD